jgi:hypothetical protein
MHSRSQDTHTRLEYDISTAVTFLLAGLGIGSLFGIIYSATLHHSNGETSQQTQQALR